MYCELCGVDAVGSCPGCGRTLLPSNSSVESSISQQAEKEGAPYLWNPDIAAALSWVLFTSIFGALIHAANWKRLGKPRRMWASMAWSMMIPISSLALGMSGALSGSPKLTYKVMVLTAFINVALWYFISGRSQSKYILEHMGKDYKRESWIIPIGLAMIIVTALNIYS